ncbi:MAG: hypothetical protein IJH45_05675 [Firmicutes bacterium]|jgi:hypothetical protein|nr:hypothetical protein [Bacillota bacterium]
MKEISNNIDENKLWRLCFPHFLPRAEAAGVFVMASAEVARKRYQDQPLSDLPLEKAELRLELACAALWDSVKDLFLCDFFPHLLAAATDILRAVDFGDEAEGDRAAQIKELVDALNECELICARLDRTAPPQPPDPAKVASIGDAEKLSAAAEEEGEK